MSFGLNWRDIPRIQSFDDALRQCDVLPSRDPLLSYLSRKYDKSKTLVKELHNGEVCSVAIKYHRTELITYMRDGRVFIKPGWDSTSDRVIFDRCLPLGIDVFSCRGLTAFKLNKEFEFIPREGFELEYQDGKWVLPEQPTCHLMKRYTIDRKVSKQATKILDDVMVFCKLKKPKYRWMGERTITEHIRQYANTGEGLLALSTALCGLEHPRKIIIAALGGIKTEPIPLGDPLPDKKSPWEEFTKFDLP